MIDIRHVSLETREATYFCEECENEYGGKVEIRWKSKTRPSEHYDAFMKKHAACEEKAINERLTKATGHPFNDPAAMRAENEIARQVFIQHQDLTTSEKLIVLKEKIRAFRGMRGEA